jgi:hypothetical protein
LLGLLGMESRRLREFKSFRGWATSGGPIALPSS